MSKPRAINPATGKVFNPSPGFIRLTEALFAAQAWESLVRDKVVPYQTAILGENEFYVAPEMRPAVQERGERILDPKLSYLMGDEDFARYHALTDEARKAAGLKIRREGNCPLLEAETTRMAAEHAFLAALPDETDMPQLAGIGSYIKLRGQALDLGLKLMAPYVDAKATMVRLGGSESDVPDDDASEGMRP